MKPAAEDSILIVDDVPGLCTLLARALGDLPYRVITANSVRSAMEELDAIGRIRMLVVDLGLPDGTGLDVVKEVRRRKPDMPILLISGHQVAGLEVDFLLKPFDPGEFAAKVALMAK